MWNRDCIFPLMLQSRRKDTQYIPCPFIVGTNKITWTVRIWMSLPPTCVRDNEEVPIPFQSVWRRKILNYYWLTHLIDERYADDLLQFLLPLAIFPPGLPLSLYSYATFEIPSLVVDLVTILSRQMIGHCKYMLSNAILALASNGIHLLWKRVIL